MPGHSGQISPPLADNRYEDLWVAVAAAFGVKVHTGLTPINIEIHVDNYRYELFRSIKTPEAWNWGPFLLGHADMCRRLPGVADHVYEGHLTQNPDTTFHSCDSLGPCPVRDNANVVQIIPVTNHAFSIDNDKIPARPAEVVEMRSYSTMELNNLERKSDNAPQSRPKRLKETVMKEPGHTLLPQRDNWWVRAGTMTRPTIVSPSGEPLSYYIVLPVVPRTLPVARSVITALFSKRTTFIGATIRPDRPMSVR